jgi:D-glycero-D-manno-heptose 1,7-bisphosphate phosphatase
MRRAVFLDRDGVINRDHGYVHRWEDFEFLPGVLEAASRLVAGGWTLVVVTNQSGIARGYYTEEAYRALTQRMKDVFAQRAAPLAAVYHCPHHPAGRMAGLAVECDCRKPAPGLFLRARDELALSLPDSVMIGDKPSDVSAARAAGVGRVFLVRSGQTGRADGDTGADSVFDSLAECANHLLQ